MSQGDVWTRFTGPATRAVQYAQEEARKLGGNTVATEHILLGLLREGDSTAARVLERLGVSRDQVRRELGKLGLVQKPVKGNAPTSWSPKAKRVLELALEEASELNPRLGLPNYIDTEHVLLGVIREGEGQAAELLRAMGVDFDRARKEVISQLGRTPARAEHPRPGAAEAAARAAAPMYELTVETEFSAAHCLKDYEGACARLHGHNYRVLIRIAGQELDDRGMLLDFREVRRICESSTQQFDHRHLNELPEFAQQNPTTENIARLIFHSISAALAQLPGPDNRKPRAVKVTVFESSKSAASYSER